MDKDQLLEQAHEVIDAHPGLNMVSGDDGVIFSGKYIFDGGYNDVPYCEEFDLEILIPWSYPMDFPVVRENGDRIKKTDYGHIFEGDALCLGAACDLIDRIQSSHSLLEYLDEVIRSYLYGFLYYEEYGVAPPFGERSHGLPGLKEAYMDRYGVTQDASLYGLLNFIGKDLPIRGHVQCPCGSGKRLRDCHGPALQRDKESAYFPRYRLEALKILQWGYKEMLNQSEAEGRLRAAVRFGRLI